MAESPRRVDLQLTIPAAAPFRAVAAELAQKFAEYSGAETTAAKSLAQAVEASLAPVAAAHPDSPIEMKMTTEGRELVVTSNSGSTTKRTTCPLPD
jgi:hypothetical protein